MTVVVDASVIVACLIDRSWRGEWAEDIVRERKLLVPELALIEVTSVLRRLDRNKVIEADEAMGSILELQYLPVQLVSIAPLIDRIWDLRHNYTSYDATYVAVAESFEVPLATLDLKLAGAPAECEFITPGSG